MFLPVDVVAVHAQCLFEAPVASVRLALAECWRHHRGVEKADLRRRRGILAQLTRRCRRLCAIGNLVDVFETIRCSRGSHVLFDERLFEIALVRLHLEGLDEVGVDHSHRDRRKHDEARRGSGKFPVALEDPREQKERDDNRRNRENRFPRDQCVDVGVCRAIKLLVRGSEGRIPFEPVLGRKHKHVRHRDDTHVRARCASKFEALFLIPLDAAVDEVPEDSGERARENHEVDEPERRLDHGKGEHVKRNVFMENRIGFPKRLLVEHEQDLLPLPRKGESTKNPENHRGSNRDELAKRLDRVAEPRDRDVFTGDGHDLRPVLVAHPQAYENRGGNGHEPHEEQDPLRDPLLHEEVVEAELVEPHVARRNLSEPCKRHDQLKDN